ncbi:MAG: glycosyltransferase [Crocinitomicaceae bacterium]|nr:glycosyltransferase [Crocinitomicaceae bacterium]MBK8926478.1 glycosyltransferase [Crocinitomicaceae bacterium]
MNWILFAFCLGMVCLQFLIALVMLSIIKKQNSKITISSSDKDLSILIPFRNEAKRISSLIKSFNESVIAVPSQLEIIFIDDHSTDQSVEEIKKSKLPILLLKNEGHGKKSAIQTGVQQAKHEYILTLDADVAFDKNYLDTLLNYLQDDMLILPVEMTGHNLLSRLASVEFDWLQQLTFSTPSPLMCNGANLVFKKSSFTRYSSERTDELIASGDDLFLLKIFRQKNEKIRRINQKTFQVTTPAPDNFSSLLKQRKRWAGKMKYLVHPQIVMACIFLLAIQGVFIVSIYFSFYNSWWLIIPAIKYLAELFLTKNLPFFERLVLVMLHQFYYPLYLISLILPVSDDEKWKQNTSQ